VKKEGGAPEEYIIKTLDSIAKFLGLTDAAMAPLMIIFLTEEK